MTSEKQPRKIPLNTALSLILLSVLVLSGSVGLAILYFQHVKENHASNDAFNIVAIIQTTSHHEALNTAYLAELLDLSTDKPTNLYRFNSKEAQRKLLASPLITHVEIKKVRPGTIYIDYEMRRPIAFLSDYSNTAIDSKGVPFPFSPFFTPKSLPEIYLGMGRHNPEGGEEALDPAQMKLALDCLQYLSKHCCPENAVIKKIDVSQAFAPSYGLRQIVVTMEDVMTLKSNGKNVLYTFPRILRLPAEDYKQALANYGILRKRLLQEKPPASKDAVVRVAPLFIDLRLPSLAYMQCSI